jgi:hypothetical protein
MTRFPSLSASYRASQHPGKTGLFTRKLHRLYFRRICGRVWTGGLSRLVNPVFTGHFSLSLHYPGSARPLQPITGRQLVVCLFRLCVCQYWHGDWCFASGGRTVAASQLRRYLDGDVTGQFWNLDVDTNP